MAEKLKEAEDAAAATTITYPRPKGLRIEEGDSSLNQTAPERPMEWRTGLPLGTGAENATLAANANKFYEAATTRGSIFTHDTHVVAALQQMGAAGFTSQSDVTGVGSFGTESADPTNAQKLGSMFGKDSAKLTGEKKEGFMSKLTGFFSADSPWMTKLGDFFGGESSFLSGLSGIFGGLGDIFGQLMGGMGGGGWMSLLSLIGMANGGVIKGGFRKYANGGIANSPTLGMVGEGKYNEAIVPLPNGKAIPVDMRSSAQNNNVTVNVSSDGQTQTEGQDNEGLGNAIAKAVQEELQNQKRAGGILNRYGTA